MTRLFIEGKEVALPSDLVLDFYSQNPFFTKNGDYTFDMDIDLAHPNNRLIYQSINRLDVTKRPTNRSAVLMCGPMEIIRGTEVILSIEDNVAKIQIVGGNSELNYLSGGEQTLRQLDLGNVTVSSSEQNNLNRVYPNVNHVCCPVLSERGTYDISGFTDKNDVLYNELEWDTRNGYVYKENTQMVTQPFLLYCIDRVVAALGYTIVENILLNDDLACRLIVVNGIKSSQLNRILPKWKVDEFLTEIEKFFNVIFFVDQTNKEVRILRVYDYYTNTPIQEIDDEDLIDYGEKKYDQEESLYITYNNINYNLPSSKWYRYQYLSNDIKEKCEQKNITSGEIESIVITNEPYTLWNVTDFGVKIVQSQLQETNGTFVWWEIADMLGPVVDDNSDNECELKIIPAEIFANNIWTESADFGGTKYYTGWLTHAVPVIANVKEAETQKFLYQEIENGVQEEESDDSHIFISIYLGLKPYLYSAIDDVEQPGVESILIPHAIAFPYIIHKNRLSGGSKITKYNTNLTLSIKPDVGSGTWSRYYASNIQVDTKTEYVFQFRSDRIYDSKSIFLIRNKKYYCKELHYTINAEGLEKIVEGTFYLIP